MNGQFAVPSQWQRRSFLPVLVLWLSRRAKSGFARLPVPHASVNPEATQAQYKDLCELIG
jgi:hypothetical protein